MNVASVAKDEWTTASLFSGFSASVSGVLDSFIKCLECSREFPFLVVFKVFSDVSGGLEGILGRFA